MQDPPLRRPRRIIVILQHVKRIDWRATSVCHLSAVKGRLAWRVIILAAALAIICMLPHRTDAMESGGTASRYLHRVWDARDGIDSPVRALALADDGFLWVGTYHGLSRFDGVAFVGPEALGLPEVARRPISYLSSRGGRLYIGFEGSGGAILEHGRLRRFGSDQSLFEFTSFATRPDEQVWAVANGTLWLLSGDRLLPIPAGFECPSGRVDQLESDARGTLWLIDGAKGQINFLRAGSARCEHLDLPFKARYLALTNDVMWVAGDGGVWATAMRDGFPRGEARRLTSVATKSVFALTSGDLHVATDSSHLRFTAARAWALGLGELPAMESFGARLGLASDRLETLLEDRAGNVWIATDRSLERLGDSRFTWADLPSERVSYSYRIAAAPGGELLAANWQSKGILRIGDRGVSRLAGAAMDKEISALHVDSLGTIWAATDQGLFRYDLTRGLTPVGHALGYINPPRSITSDAEGGLWLDGNSFGKVHRYIRGARQDPYGRAGFPDAWSFRGGIADTTGRLWLATADGVLVVDHGVASSMLDKTHGLTFGHISTFAVRGPRLWAGGNRGAGLFYDGAFHPLIDSSGMKTGAITGIVETASGDLWLNGEDATFLVTAAQLQGSPPDLSKAVHMRRFDAQDGRRGVTPYSQSTPTMVEDARGRLWISTEAGIARIDTGGDVKPAPFPLTVVDRMTVGAQTRRTDGSIQLPARTERFSIHYAAPELSRPEKISFRYQLVGVDRTWQEVTKARTAAYTNVGPGQYEFLVSSTNADGDWNPQVASLTFEIAPSWYQARWFRIACVVLALIGLWAIYRLRLHWALAQLRSQQAVQLQERERIARELHDTLLQSVQALGLRVGAVADDLPQESSARAQLTQALDIADDTMAEGRAQIANLRSEGTSSSGLDGILTELALEARRCDLEFCHQIVGRPRPLQPICLQELRKLLLEAMRNAIRHARCRGIDIAAHYSGQAFELTFQDDGLGMNIELISRGREGHWGLQNMRERIVQLGGAFELTSIPDHGVKIAIRLKASTAYLPAGPWYRRLSNRQPSDVIDSTRAHQSGPTNAHDGMRPVP